jgi:hypothetical protein
VAPRPVLPDQGASVLAAANHQLTSPLSFLASPLDTPSLLQLQRAVSLGGVIPHAENHSAAKALAHAGGANSNSSTVNVSSQFLSYFNENSRSPLPPQTPRLQTLTASTATNSVAPMRSQSLPERKCSVYSCFLSPPITPPPTA